MVNSFITAEELESCPQRKEIPWSRENNPGLKFEWVSYETKNKIKHAHNKEVCVQLRYANNTFQTLKLNFSSGDLEEFGTCKQWLSTN